MSTRYKICFLTIRVMNFSWVILLYCLLQKTSIAKTESTSLTPSKKIVCETEICKVSADAILESLNKSVDPCEDFYSFACGGWMEKKHLEQNVFKSIRVEIFLEIINLLEEVEEESLTKTERTVVNIFNTCKTYNKFDEDTIKWFEVIFEKIGGFPLLDPEWNDKDYDWTEAVIQLSSQLNLYPLILVDSKVDNRNSSKNIIMISQPLRGAAVQIETIALYPLYFQKARGKEYDEVTVLFDILALNDLQDKLKSITKYEDEFDDMSKFELTMKVKDLQNLIPSVNWLLFLQKTTEGMLSFKEDDDVMVRGKDYLINLVEMIDNGTITNRMIANFLAYNALLKTMENFPVPYVYLLKNFRLNNRKKRNIDINEMERKLSPEEGQKVICLSNIILPLNFAIDHMFLTRRKHCQSKLNDIVDNLRISLKQLLKRQSWFSKETKKFLLQKQKEMIVIYDYPNWIIDPYNIEKFYQTLPEASNNSLENYAMMSRFARRASLLFVAHQNKRAKWPPISGITASSLNAYYMRNFNTILLPFVLKHPSVYHKERPSYLNYGAVGFIIGHEMGHGYDLYDIQKDGIGILKSWVDENFKNEYLKRTHCFINQYSNYTLNDFGDQLDGRKTISQNIADHIGLKISYRAFRRFQRLHGQEDGLAGLEEYTPEQLFFIAFGTSWCETKDATNNYWKREKSDHSPAKFRILGTLTNMKEFSKAFNCKKRSNINQKKRCHMF